MRFPRRWTSSTGLVGLALGLSIIAPSPAEARQSVELDYSYEQLWRTAVRMVAVDFRFPITERDPDNGYLLFEYRDGGRSHPAALELVRLGGDRGPRVRVTITIGTMPGYVERMMADRLSRKAVDELGPPMPRRPPERPSRPPSRESPEEDDDDEES